MPSYRLRPEHTDAFNALINARIGGERNYQSLLKFYFRLLRRYEAMHRDGVITNRKMRLTMTLLAFTMDQIRPEAAAQNYLSRRD